MSIVDLQYSMTNFGFFNAMADSIRVSTYKGPLNTTAHDRRYLKWAWAMTSSTQINSDCTTRTFEAHCLETLSRIAWWENLIHSPFGRWAGKTRFEDR